MSFQTKKLKTTNNNQLIDNSNINIFYNLLNNFGYYVYKHDNYLKIHINNTIWSILFDSSKFDDNIWEIAIMVNRTFYTTGYGKTFDDMIYFFNNKSFHINKHSNLNPYAFEFKV